MYSNEECLGGGQKAIRREGIVEARRFQVMDSYERLDIAVQELAEAIARLEQRLGIVSREHDPKVSREAKESIVEEPKAQLASMLDTLQMKLFLEFRHIQGITDRLEI